MAKKRLWIPARATGKKDVMHILEPALERSKELEVDNARKTLQVDTERRRGSLARGTSSHIEKAQVCCVIRPLTAPIPVRRSKQEVNYSCPSWRFPHGA
ncbi:hypothetical protein MGYG_06147 [Nannizzia gypsea CBS 118893]|uniref:Uncharacterized protein n=1 Tax=Arthroderma gypseum (strain ATCC MYA-4604 / CBS 118893) TaxID=535722 RepID=E4V0L5_ARTGP|nr:hypothetical protein MGYG_06147 [Nannizzia gypsea CBS 118893]EFR03152.1 hypothetical protein MGYG_06147 [Nannizzia gypsea CBS 118893]